MQKSGVTVKELCRKHGFCDGSLYTWRSKYGGMDVSEMKRMKDLEQGDSRLKLLLAETLPYKPVGIHHWHIRVRILAVTVGLNTIKRLKGRLDVNRGVSTPTGELSR